MSKKTWAESSKPRILNLNESVDAIIVEKSTTCQDHLVKVLYKSGAGHKIYYLKITARGLTLV